MGRKRKYIKTLPTSEVVEGWTDEHLRKVYNAILKASMPNDDENESVPRDENDGLSDWEVYVKTVNDQFFKRFK